MDLIYNLAEITIVAAAGSDANRGLPGVGTNKRQVMEHTRIGSQGSTLLFTTSADANEEFLQSKWSTRGWTYQEGILSKRLLIFTESQIIFECAAVRLYENIPLDLEEWEQEASVRDALLGKPLLGLREDWEAADRSRIVPAQVDGTQWRARYRATRKQKKSEREERRMARDARLVNLDKHIEKYCEKELSFPKDALNAFLGILRYSGLSSYYGLRLGWMHESSIIAVSLLRWHRYVPPSIARPDPPSSLSDSHDGSLIKSADGHSWGRVSELPSWSWVGWTGEITLIDEEEFINMRRISAIQFRTLIGMRTLSPQGPKPPIIKIQDDWSAHLDKRIWIQNPAVWSNVKSRKASLTMRNLNMAMNKVDFDFRFGLQSFSLEVRLCGRQMDINSPGLIAQDLIAGRVEAIRVLDNWFLLVRQYQQVETEQHSSETLFERIGTVACNFRAFNGREVPLGILHQSQKTYCIC
ncbi:hypothetical protein BX600DRAFT_555450 [Xylariales sp. PMI_506]|nr:hypothetical protein BX600DRAFT_555450 [Xylariales sp. PMI_506]